MSGEQLYYVQDTRQIVGNCALWWRKESRGYTTEIDDAGLYTAEEVSRMRPSDHGWPKEYIDSIVVKHVRLDTGTRGLLKPIIGGCK